METIFIINPKAGRGAKIKRFMSAIDEASERFNKKSRIYFTQAVGDACRFVREYCRENGAARFIACGGDGTLNEVLNGAITYDGAEVGVIPMGTGNDFCRNFSSECDFKSVALQMTSRTTRCDAIKYTTEVGSLKKSGYGVNMFNIGFDCNVADTTDSIKRKTIASGSLAYLISIFLNLVKKRGANLKIEIDGAERHTGELLLTSVANGSYCGGGIKSNPNASVSDGKISINIVRNISRLKFISLLPYYMKGNFMKISGIDKIILTEKCKKVRITPHDFSVRMCNDGEITDAGRTEFEIVPNAFNFVVPLKKPQAELLSEIKHCMA